MGKLSEAMSRKFVPEEYTLDTLPKFADFVRSVDEDLFLFAVRLAYEPLIPVERSPLTAISLAKLCGEVGVSAGICDLGGAHGWVLLVLAPTMLVVLRGANGLGRALEEVVHRRVVSLLTGTDPYVPDESDSAG